MMFSSLTVEPRAVTLTVRTSRIDICGASANRASIGCSKDDNQRLNAIDLLWERETRDGYANYPSSQYIITELV